MAYCDYAFYRETYKGNAIPEMDFDRFAERASEYIDRVSRWSISTIDEHIKRAVCAVAEAWQINEQGGDLVSQSVGSWSKAYSKAIQSDSDRLLEAAQRYVPDLIKIVGWV